MAPVEVNVDNEDVVRNRLYPKKPELYKWKIGLCSVLLPHQHSIGYTGDGIQDVQVEV